MNIKPLLRYRIREGLLGIASYMSVLLLVTLLLVVLGSGISESGNMNFVAVGTASSIFFFVWGIASIREDLRLGLQFGLSRRTVFVANLAAALVLSIVAATAGELLTAAGQAMASGQENLSVGDFYQLIFLQTKGTLPFSQHLASGFFNLTLQWLCYGAGLVISLLYYRLSKFWIVVVSLAGGLVLVVGVPVLSWKFAPLLAPVMQWMLSSLGNWSIVMAVLTVVLLVGSFLLLRRAPAKAIK